jgi:membrane protease YdiL (CAAX protease family)
MSESLQVPANETVPANHDVRWVFLGPNGLRAGWGILSFILIFIVGNFLFGWALRPLFHQLSPPHAKGIPTAMPLRLAYLIEGMLASCVVIATIAMAMIEGRSIFAYGYKAGHATVRFVSGLVLGFAAISALVFILAKSGLLVVDGQLLHSAAAFKYGLAWAIFFLLVAIFEESTMRGYLQYAFTRGIGFWWGALLLSFLFGFSHGSNPGESPVGMFSAGAVGLVFCLSLWYTGSLWWALGFHAAWDWGESFFYGTSDSGLIVQHHLLGEHPMGKILWSGGATGPEGSLLVLPLLFIVAVCMWLWWGRRVKSPFADAAWRPAVHL